MLGVLPRQRGPGHWFDGVSLSLRELGGCAPNELVVPLVDPAGGHLYAIVPLLVRRDDGPDRVPQLLQGVLDADTGADWNEW